MTLGQRCRAAWNAFRRQQEVSGWDGDAEPPAWNYEVACEDLSEPAIVLLTEVSARTAAVDRANENPEKRYLVSRVIAAYGYAKRRVDYETLCDASPPIGVYRYCPHPFEEKS